MSANPSPEPTNLSPKLINGPSPVKRNLPSATKNITTNDDINLSQKGNLSIYANSKSKQTKIDLLMAKTPEIDDSKDSKMQRTIQISTAAVIAKRETPPQSPFKSVQTKVVQV